MSATELLLIDLSGIAHQIFHQDTNNPDPSRISTQTIARVRALASAHPHAAVCCDNGKSFRADIDPQYKATRDTENRAPLRHQMQLACEALKRDGFVVWSVPGFEGDDIIASATAAAIAMDPDVSVQIVSADKDLLQLVSERVTVKSLVTGNVAGPAEVFDKFGVKPEQMGDYLALVGDKSDNIIGAKGIGGVIAARLLSEFGRLDVLYDAMSHGVVSGVTAGMRTNLMEFKPRWPTVAKLIALRTDAPIEFSEIAAERTAPPMEDAAGDDYIGEESMSAFMEQDKREADAMRAAREPFKQGADSNDAPLPFGRELSGSEAVSALGAAMTSAPKASGTLAGQPSIPNGADSGRASVDAVTAAGAVSRLPQSDAAASVPNAGGSGQLVQYTPVDFSQQLEPRSMQEAVQLAQRMYESRLFGAYGTPQAVLATVLAGRELGIPAMASLRAFHIIEGKPQMSAGTIQSLVLKSGRAKYFRCSERTATRATFVTQRGDDPEMALTYTIEEGRAAWPKDENAWNKSGWGRNPADMLVARASSKLARLVYPDVVSGLYAPEEMD